MRALLLLLCLPCANTSVLAQSGRRVTQTTALQRSLEAITRETAVARAHWGISVTTLDGVSLAGINDGQYFMPASNAKLFTTAAAMALLPMDEQLKTDVIGTGYFRTDGTLEGDLVLRGVGDANFSGRPLPYQPRVADRPEPPRDDLRYVNELADKIKAAGIARVTGNIVGDDSLFPWDPYPADWAIDDTPWYYGAPINALMVADNALTLTITPGTRNTAGEITAPRATVLPALPYYTLDVQATTSPMGLGTKLDVQRDLGERTIHIYGSIAADAEPYTQDMSIADPAEYAAMALKQALEERGIPVTGEAKAKHAAHFVAPSFAAAVMQPVAPLAPSRARDVLLRSTTGSCSDCSEGWVSRVVAEHAGAPWYDDIVVTNKVSENQHAELFLRQLGFFYGVGATTLGGARVVRTFLTTRVGIDPQDFFFYDGSGLSGHDLVTPRAATRLLRYAATQPWGERWKASLPVGGVDGSLRSRFTAEPLAGHIFAKTGTLGEARALSGYLECASGQTVVFSVMVSTHTPQNNDDQKAMDRIVSTIAGKC